MVPLSIVYKNLFSSQHKDGFMKKAETYRSYEFLIIF